MNVSAQQQQSFFAEGARKSEIYVGEEYQRG